MSALVARRIIVSAVTQWESGLELDAIQAMLTRNEDTERTERMIARVRRFLAEGVAEDEPEFIAAVKAAKPKITASELKGLDYAGSRRRFREATVRSTAALKFFSDSCALSESFRLRRLQ
jgi:hypothetical protein